MEMSKSAPIPTSIHPGVDLSSGVTNEKSPGPNRTFGLEIEQGQEQAAQRGPDYHSHGNMKDGSAQLDPDEHVQEALHDQYVLDDVHPSNPESGGQPATSRVTGSRVSIKRVLKSHDSSLSALRRIITLLTAASDPSIPYLHSALESTTTLYTITEHTPFPTLHTYISTHGPQSPDSIKSLTTQLFSGIAVIFLAGFAHLRICDETILISNGGRLVISDFQYAFPYSKEKGEEGMYASVEEKFGEDVYVAPEAFREIRYNGRKAVIWSCGVVLYYITTATTAPLSGLKHPSFDPHPTSQTPTTNTTAISDPLPPPPPPPPSSHRRSSSSISTPIPLPLLPLPPSISRLSLSPYLRSILPKMLHPTPSKRPELIEVAAKVPKMIATKETRSLMEVAWGDYKWNVGPMAGLRPGDAEQDGDEGGSVFSWSGRSGRVGSFWGGGSGISVGSGWSAGSLRGLLSGGGRRKSHWI